MRFQITKRLAVGFHTQHFWFHLTHPWVMSCWGVFELPHKSVYYSGKMDWWSWWRLYFIVERP